MFFYTGPEIEIQPPLLKDEFFDRSDREEEVLRYIAGTMCYKFKLEKTI